MGRPLLLTHDGRQSTAHFLWWTSWLWNRLGSPVQCWRCPQGYFHETCWISPITLPGELQRAISGTWTMTTQQSQIQALLQQTRESLQGIYWQTWENSTNYRALQQVLFLQRPKWPASSADAVAERRWVDLAEWWNRLKGGSHNSQAVGSTAVI